jgi:hypothetical protein
MEMLRARATPARGQHGGPPAAHAGAGSALRDYLTISSSSTSNTSVAPGLISGGEPRSP